MSCVSNVMFRYVDMSEFYVLDIFEDGVMMIMILSSSSLPFIILIRYLKVLDYASF